MQMCHFLIMCFIIGPILTGRTFCSTEPEWVTILVHGNISVKPFLSPSHLLNFMCDTVEDTEYAYAAHEIRIDPFFYEAQQMQNVGLIRIERSERKGDANGAFVALWDALAGCGYGLCSSHNNSYYTYGWSGLMSHKARMREAGDFYRALEKLVQEYRDHKKCIPKIRIIGFSHGGNVCLNIAAFHAQKDPNAQIISCIDELILLGIPVQSENEQLSESDFFKKIYHFYSPADGIQRIDFFSFHRFFSKKRFHNHRGNNLVQVEFSVLTQNERYSRRGRKKYYADYSPGHTELWFFGWTPFNYRREFPLYPFGLVHLLPIFLTALEKQKMSAAASIQLYPYEQKLCVNGIFSDFLSKEQMESLAQKALSYAPSEHSRDDELAHMSRAVQCGKARLRALKYADATRLQTAES